MTPFSAWLHEFGGNGPLVHLAHGNGFPPAAYSPLAQTLTDRYRVIGLPMRPLWPGNQTSSAPTWYILADDLTQGLDALNLKGILGVGHSMGSVLTLLAAIRRPDLFRAIALVDPVILPPMWLWILRLMRALGLYWRQPFIQGALRRRRTWPDRQACLEQYRTKPPLATWPEASLRAYVEAATRPRADGQVELVYPPEWEAHIFATTPTDIWDRLPDPNRSHGKHAGASSVCMPVLFIRGERSIAFRLASQKRMERCLPQAQFVVIRDAGHLVPFERPLETGAAIREFFEAVSVPGPA